MFRKAARINVGDKIAFIGGEGEEAPRKKRQNKKKKSSRNPQNKKNGKSQAEAEKPAPAQRKREGNRTAAKRCRAAVSAARSEGSNRKLDPKKKSAKKRAVKRRRARRVAAELDVDLASVKGTGPDGL